MPRLKESKPKAGRRGNNEGSYYQRKSDGLWCGTVTVGYKTDGKLIRKTVYGKTQQEVIRKGNALTSQVFQNGYTTVSSHKGATVETLIKDWYELFKAPNVKGVTDEKFRSMLMKHIFPAFGTLDIKAVDTKRLQRFFNEMKTTKVKDRVGYSSDFIGKMKNLLNNFFEYAVKKNYVATNPMLDVDIRKATSHETNEKKGKALPPETRIAVLEWVEENPVLRPILITSTFTGLRPQETVTLRWEDVNFDSKALSVKTALNRVVQFDDDWNVISRGIKVGETKTPRSVRTIAMPPVVVDVLREWKQYCLQRGIQSEFVFPNTKTGGMRTYNGLRSLLRRFLAKHGLEGVGTLYTLRHTFATILLEQRENPKIVMNLMGHTKVSTTLDLYSHVVSTSVYEQTAQTLDGVYNSLTQKKNPPADTPV